MARRAPEEPRDWITQVGRATGLGGIVLSTVVWLIADRVSYELLGTFLSLWGFTEGAAALKQLRGGGGK